MKRRKKRGTFPIVLGLLLITAALSIAAYNLYDSFRAEAIANDVLDDLLPQMTKEPTPAFLKPNVPDPTEQYPDYILNPNMEMPVKAVESPIPLAETSGGTGGGSGGGSGGGYAMLEYIGVLDIPALGMKLPVLGTWSYSNLTITACRYSGSAYQGNMVICGHNYMSLFGRIGRLSIDDTVEFTDMDGNVFTYQVKEVETVIPQAVQVMTTGDWDLTLFTCTAGAQTRIAVRCVQVSPRDTLEYSEAPHDEGSDEVPQMP